MQKFITFESGLKLVFAQNTAVRSVSIGVFVGAGIVKETPEIAGISHCIEHMVFKGTKTRSAFDIANDIDSIGAQINAYTAKTLTAFYTVSLDTNASKCMDVLADLYFNPQFDQLEFEKERKVIIEEINESLDSPDDVCTENLFSTFYKGTPYEKQILGTKDTLNAMTVDDLKSYHKKHYVAKNTVISIAGNLTEQEAIALVEQHFESKIDKNVEYDNGAPEIYATNSALAHAKRKIEQAHIAFLFPSYTAGDDLSSTVQLLTAVFCGEMSSRLFQSIREKLGLCYTVYGYPTSSVNTGAYLIYLSTNPDSVEQAVKAIRHEIDLLLENGITDDELNRGKEQLKTSLVLGQESTRAMMRLFGTHALTRNVLYDFDERISRVDKITKEEVLQVANYIFDFDKVSASIVADDDSVDILSMMKNA